MIIYTYIVGIYDGMKCPFLTVLFSHIYLIYESYGEEEIKQVLITKTPEECGLKGFLWDMRNVLALILLLFYINVPRSSMSNFLPDGVTLRNSP